MNCSPYLYPLSASSLIRIVFIRVLSSLHLRLCFVLNALNWLALLSVRLFIHLRLLWSKFFLIAMIALELYQCIFSIILSDDLHINDTIHSISLSVINSDNCSAALKLNEPPSSYQHPPTYTLHPICYWLRLEGELLLYYILYISIYTRTYQSQSQKQSDRLIYYIHTNTFAADDSHYLFPLSNQHNHHFTTSTDLITSIAPVMKYRKQLARL